MKRYDAIVIGAGPAGGATALDLARRGWSVAVVEKAAFPRRKVCGEYISSAAWGLLQRLGLGDLQGDRGPAVTRVGLLAGDSQLMPPAGARSLGFALGRHILDTVLCERAVRAGAGLWQPYKALAMSRERGEWIVTVGRHGGDGTENLRARIVVAAHGSWEVGALPTQPDPAAVPAAALLGFKARFRDAALPPGLMPLVLFPGGYGGLVHTDSGAVSFSFCIRNDTLRRCRERHGGPAGESACHHIARNVPALQEILARAQLESPWQGAGPIRPGFRPLARDGLFRVGNAAGEAHPLVAEGICMAIEAATLIGDALSASDGSSASLRAAERAYRAAWRTTIAGRIVAATAFARINATAPRLAASVARGVPRLFEMATRWSGKGRTAWA